jgi:Mg2+ and Co2+ transporters
MTQEHDAAATGAHEVVGGVGATVPVMRLIQVGVDGAREQPIGDIERLLAEPDGFIWLDVPLCAAEGSELLRRVFRFHELAIHDCVVRNHVSKIHSYEDHVFTVLHAPQIGGGGHVHYIELDQFLGPNYLVTVHGPLNEAVAPAVADMDTGNTRARLMSGVFTPNSPFALSAAIIRAMARREIDMIAALAERSGQLEQKVVLAGGPGEGAEEFLNDLFRVWYELLAIRTIARQSSSTYDRVARLARFLPPEVTLVVADLADGFDMVATMADGQREFLHGVIEYFQTRVGAHQAISAEDTAQTSVRQNDDMRKISAWVGIVAVPTAVTGFFGQNVPYPGFGTFGGFILSTLVMIASGAALYLFFKKKRWL